MVKFGERLKAARTAKHMSQQALPMCSARAEHGGTV